MRMRNAQSLILIVLFALSMLVGISHVSLANLESAEIIIIGDILEPGANVQMSDPNTIGDGLAVFEFSSVRC